MAGLDLKVDDREAFQQLLDRWAAPEQVRRRLDQAGFNTVALLAHALPSLDALEAFIESLLGRPDGSDPTAPLFSPEAASLRRIVKECHRSTQPHPAAGVDLTSTQGPKNKLAAADLSDMLTDFQRKYPSELISPEILPSLSFLNLLHEAVESKQISWISWRLRTSQSDEQAMTEKRRPRTDSALLQSLLSTQQDELVVDVPRHLPLESVLRRYLDRLSVALSLLDACHLLTLKKMSEKFISLATAVPLDRSLRGPTLAEAMDADRTLWTSIGSLQREYKWSLHDCLSEVTHVRSDMHNALAPRPRAGPPPNEPKQKRQRVAPPPAPHATPRPPKTPKKTPAKKSTASDSGRNKVSLSNWPDTWARQIGGVGVCIRFHTDKCRNKNCRFSHKCPILNASGTPCGAAHSALAHSGAPH